MRIECILDDAPTRSELRGIPVRRAGRDALPAGVPVVPSSDAHEKAIVERAAAMFAGRNPVVPVYTSDQQAVAAPLTPPASQPQIIRHHAQQLEEMAGHRIDLGLPEQRSWMGAFVQRLAVPSWVQGFVNYRDAQFLWDLVEATRPDVVAEIGTASGVSTGLLASACEYFGGTTRPCGRVHTFDIAERCYFDQTRLVGAVALETFPHLRDAIEINPRRTATDAARRFSVGEVDLAFIDGDHRHPTPTLDLLALLYALKPGAWVVLHDIELSEVYRATSSVGKPDWELATGAETLFHRWPFQKTQPRYPLAIMNNIGAIKLPMNPGDAVGFLLEHLREAWEINDAPNLTVLRAALRAA
jgi:predicted O-methyltransferase YrrM